MLRYVIPVLFGLTPALALAAPTHGVPNASELRSKDAKIAQQTQRLTQRAVIAAQRAAANGKLPYQAAAKATGIPKGPLLKSRRKHLASLGLSDAEGRLYIFVSPTTMPKPMIRAYARDAMWTGAILVVRGLPPGTSLSTFVRKTLLPYAKAGIALQIDPRLYDAFNIQAVPALVFTTALSTQICKHQHPVSEKLAGKAYTFDRCNQIPSSEYWKVTGGVTTLWALRHFKKHGAPVQAMLRSLKAEVPYHKKLHGISRAVFAATVKKQSTHYLIDRYLHSGKLPGAQMLSINHSTKEGSR